MAMLHAAPRNNPFPTTQKKSNEKEKYSDLPKMKFLNNDRKKLLKMAHEKLR